MRSAIDNKLVPPEVILGGHSDVSADAADAAARVAWTLDDEEAIRVLKLAGTFALVMVVIQVTYNLRHGGPGATPTVMAVRWSVIFVTCVFLGMLWTNAFKRHIKSWTVSYFVFMFAAVTATSHFTQNTESRFIVLILFPIVTAGFITWGPRAQLVVSAITLGAYVLANVTVPIPDPYKNYHCFGLVGVAIFTLCTSFLIDRYRQRLVLQVSDLEKAGRFREGQIATMSHDIRSPAAALSGYANLLEEENITESERAEILARIGSTAWRMDLAVGNVLDLYDVQERVLEPFASEIDPNPLLAEAAADCAMQARRRGLTLRTEFSRLPVCYLDPRHLERIVKNLLAFAIGRMVGSEVILHTSIHDKSIVIDIIDKGPALTAAEMQALFERPSDGDASSANRLGLYIARMMAEAAGGHLDARLGGRGLTLIAELPIGAGLPDSK
ncbi:MAG TPA: HAMP domain-containing sensor histidine kinase [Candidatus Binataceae bacterium]|nr:HAMP domain-containing sensor histidine kinase [Candidatus Binataceae bacterium]